MRLSQFYSLTPHVSTDESGNINWLKVVLIVEKNMDRNIDRSIKRYVYSSN